MDIDAFILIGGRSARFGRDKAFFEFDGETLAARAARIVESALSPARLRFVASSDDQFGADLLFGLGKPVVADLKPGFGAWSGLHTALAYSQSEWALVLACDLPFVTAEFLQLLGSKCVGDINTVVPRQHDGRLQPLCAFYHVAAVRPVVDEWLSDKRSLPALATVTDLVGAIILEPAAFSTLPGADTFFHNVNTLADVTTNDAAQ